MDIKEENVSYYENYVLKNKEKILLFMQQLTVKMSTEKCSLKNFEKWEYLMNECKEVYHLFKNELIKRINDTDIIEVQQWMAQKVCPLCEELEDSYEKLTALYEEKCQEIAAKTTYFETKDYQSKSYGIKTIFSKFNLNNYYEKIVVSVKGTFRKNIR